MKYKVRNNIFETNSSSMHSLTFKKDNLFAISDLKDLNYTIVGDGEYGWGYETLTSIGDKLRYLYQSLVGDGDEQPEDTEDIKKLKQLLPNCTFVYDSEGYIDHQSYGTVTADIIESEETLREYLEKGLIIIDNDNH